MSMGSQKLQSIGNIKIMEKRQAFQNEENPNAQPTTGEQQEEGFNGNMENQQQYQDNIQEELSSNIDALTGMSAMEGINRLTTQTMEINLTVSKIE